MSGLTISELISALRKMPQDADLYIDSPFDIHPEGLISWRGNPEELALDITMGGHAPSVERFIRELEGAIGKSFEGYKGGSFVMNEHTPVWIAPYGRSLSVRATGVLEDGWRVVITWEEGP